MSKEDWCIDMEAFQWGPSPSLGFALWCLVSLMLSSMTRLMTILVPLRSVIGVHEFLRWTDISADHLKVVFPLKGKSLYNFIIDFGCALALAENTPILYFSQTRDKDARKTFPALENYVPGKASDISIHSFYALSACHCIRSRICFSYILTMKIANWTLNTKWSEICVCARMLVHVGVMTENKSHRCSWFW